MTSDARVRVVFEGDAKDLQRMLSGVRRDTADVARNTSSSWNDTWAGVSRTHVAVAGAVASIAAGVAATRELVDAASNLSEAQNKVNEVFDDGKGLVREWAAVADQSAGLSERAALDAAGSFGNMFVQLGLNKDRAGEMSIAMSELAADFASFHNADISEVLIAQQAAFRGEYDAVQRFVPTINAAAVEQKALEMGLAKTTKEISAQDKALAAYQLMIDDAGDALGDFDRTSDGLANQQRILAAQWENLTAELGAALLPAALDVVEAMNKLLEQHGDEWAQQFAEGVDLAVFGVALLADKVGDLNEKLVELTGIELPDWLWFIASNAIPGVGVLRAGLDALRGAKDSADLRATEGGRGSGMTDAEVNMESGGAPWTPPKKAPVEKLPRGGGGGGGGPKADWLSPESLALIDALVAAFPQFSGPSGMNERGLAEFRQADESVEQLRASIERTISELSLQMKDLDARGLELTPEFAALEDRMDALKDASERIDLMADMKIEPFRDAMELVADAIETVHDKARRFSEESESYFRSQLNQMANRNVRFSPEAWAAWAAASGYNVPGGGSGDLDVDAA